MGGSSSSQSKSVTLNKEDTVVRVRFKIYIIMILKKIVYWWAIIRIHDIQIGFCFTRFPKMLQDD